MCERDKGGKLDQNEKRMKLLRVMTSQARFADLRALGTFREGRNQRGIGRIKKDPIVINRRNIEPERRKNQQGGRKKGKRVGPTV